MRLRYARVAFALRRVIATYVVVTRSAARRHAVRPAHRLKLQGNPLHVTALAGRLGKCGCVMLRPNRRSGGYRAACGGYAICGAFVLSQSVAPAQAARQSAARTCVWAVRRGRRGTRYAQAESTLRRVIAPHVAVTRSAAHLYSVSPSHQLKLHGNPRHVTALAGRSGRRGTRYTQSHCAQAGYRVVCSSYAICGAPARSQAVASAQAARQSAARTCIGSATWPTRRALCSGLIDAQAGYRAACGGYVICGAFVLSHSVALAQAARQSAARTGISMAEWPTRRARYTRHIALRRLSRRMWRLHDLRRAGTQSVRRTGRNRAADNGACQRCACAVCCSAACHCALNSAIDCCL